MALKASFRRFGKASLPVHRLETKLVPGKSDNLFWLKEIFSLRKQSGFSNWPIAGWAYRKLFHMSARDVLSRITDRIYLGVDGGLETREIAFGHVAFISGSEGACDASLNRNLEGDITTSLKSELKGQYDPDTGFRVACMTSPLLAAGDLVMLFGRGVFIPRPGERPIGSIRYFPNPGNRESFLVPLLQDGRPASFYKGQAGLAFGLGQSLNHANLDFNLGAESSDAWVSVEADKTRMVTDNILAKIVVSSPGAGRVGLAPSNVAEGAADQAWQIDFLGKNRQPGRLELSVDDRRSRLHVSNRPGCNAAISALCIDLNDLGARADRVWFNFDQGMHLRAYSIQKLWTSLVWDFKRQEGYAYDWGGSPSPFRSANSIGLRILQSGPGIIEVSRISGAPLGFLSLPEQTLPMVFQDEFQSMAGYCVDWLDECGAVEIDGQKTPLGKAYSAAGFEANIRAPRQSGSPNGEGAAILAGPFLVKPLVRASA